MEKALDNLFRRIPSEDLDFVITAINVQREVGGNLSEILDTISFTIRERVRIKGEIRVMTANVRSSGTILSLIPLVLAGALWFVSPEYIGTFFAPNKFIPQPWCGIISVSVIIGLILAGYFVMMKIADIEVLDDNNSVDCRRSIHSDCRNWRHLGEPTTGRRRE